MSSQSKAPQKSRLDVLYELREKKIRCSTEELDAEIIALENEIEPEPKPAFRSIRGGGS